MFTLNPARSPIAAAEIVMQMQRPDIYAKKFELAINTGNDTMVLINDGDWRFSVCKAFPLYVSLRGIRSGTNEGFMFAQTDEGIKLIYPTTAHLFHRFDPRAFMNLSHYKGLSTQ